LKRRSPDDPTHVTYREFMDFWEKHDALHLKLEKRVSRMEGILYIITALLIYLIIGGII